MENGLFKHKYFFTAVLSGHVTCIYKFNKHNTLSSVNSNLNKKEITQLFPCPVFEVEGPVSDRHLKN